MDATQTGNITCTNVDISTQGQHCAAIATDRGRGTINVTGGTMNNAGEVSPGIYSTGTITVSDTTLSATGTSYLISLKDDDSTLANIKDNGYTIYYDLSSKVDY